MSATDDEREIHLESPVVTVDIRDRVRRIALLGLWGFIPLLLIAIIAAFLVSGPVPLVAWAGALLAVIVGAFVPSFRTVALSRIDVADGLLRMTASSAASATALGEGAATSRLDRCHATSDFTGGWIGELDDVHLTTARGETLIVATAGKAEAEALLRAVGVSVRQRVQKVPLVSYAARVPGGTVCASVLLVMFGWHAMSVPFGLIALAGSAAMDPTSTSLTHLAVSAAFAIMTAGVIAALIKVLRRRDVTLGVDGIAWTRLWSQRFFPYAEVRDLATYSRGVKVTMRSGESVRLPTTGWLVRPAGDERRNMLMTRIHEAREAAHPEHDLRSKLSLLERRDRPVAAWRDHLHRLIEASDYRAGVITAEDLGTLLEDASIPAVNRIAATVALAAKEPDEAKRRVRIAVAACADDDLRVALEHAASGEIAEAELARLERRRA